MKIDRTKLIAYALFLSITSSSCGAIFTKHLVDKKIDDPLLLALSEYIEYQSKNKVTKEITQEDLEEFFSSFNNYLGSNLDVPKNSNIIYSQEPVISDLDLYLKEIINNSIPEMSNDNEFDKFVLNEKANFYFYDGFESIYYFIESVSREGTVIKYTVKNNDSQNSILMDYSVTKFDLYSTEDCIENVNINELKVGDTIFILKNECLNYMILNQGSLTQSGYAFSIAELTKIINMSITEYLETTVVRSTQNFGYGISKQK